MADVFGKVRERFSAELNNEGDVWRILRKSTLVDLIKLSFSYYQNGNDEKHLIDIFNLSMKVKLLSRIKAINYKNIGEFSKIFKLENDFILKQYDEVFNELQPSFNNYKATNLYDLNGKIQYLKVVNNELELDSYADDIFEEIIAITYNILNK